MRPSPLWRLLVDAKSQDELMDALDKLPDEELRSACVEYFQARADLVFAIQESGRAGGASEDVLDDVAESVLRRGQHAYEAVVRGEGELPARLTWSALERDAFRGAFMNVWDRRFRDDLFDAVENA